MWGIPCDGTSYVEGGSVVASIQLYLLPIFSTALVLCSQGYADVWLWFMQGINAPDE